MHHIPTKKIEAAILAAIQRVSWYVQNNEAEFIERVREASDLRQEEAVKECKQRLSKAQRRHKELDGLVKSSMRETPQAKYPTSILPAYLPSTTRNKRGLEAAIGEWQEQLDTWNADRLNTDKFIELAKRYTDFTELTTPMLNEFIEKIIVHEGKGSGNDRRQRIDIYLNFIGAFEVPAHIVTPMGSGGTTPPAGGTGRKEAHSQGLAKSAGATEALKAADPMKWVGLMNACKAQAEEIIRYELIYV